MTVPLGPSRSSPTSPTIVYRSEVNPPPPPSPPELYNDEVNTFDHVIECLVKICDHSYIQAEQCAFIVHYSGKCGVKTGAFEELILKCNKLLEEGLSAEVV